MPVGWQQSQAVISGKPSHAATTCGDTLNPMSDTDARIGKRLQELRGEMSQAALGAAMAERGHKWSQATVWSVETGKRPMRLAEADDVASICGFGIQALVVRDALGERLSEVPGAIAATSHAARQFRESCRELLGMHFLLEEMMESIAGDFGVPDTPPASHEFQALRRQIDNLLKQSPVDIAQEVSEKFEQEKLELSRGVDN